VSGLESAVIVTVVFGYVVGLVAVAKLQGDRITGQSDRITDLANQVGGLTTEVRSLTTAVRELRAEVRGTTEPAGSEAQS
jgi:hypothetical protein